MKHKIGWPGHSSDEPASAFADKPSLRELRLTFHSESLQNLQGDEADSLALLREFACLPEIDAVDTSTGVFPCIELESPDRNQDTLPFGVEYEDKEHRRDCLIWHYRQWEQMAMASLATEIDSERLLSSRLREVLLAQAHCALRHDLFVTTSPYLIQQGAKSLFRDVNPLLPSEAIKVVGLYLRFREEYVLEASKKGARIYCDRGLFYWVLMRHRLPAMWQYFSCCVYAGPTKKEVAT
jgi:hypothetical protein